MTERADQFDERDRLEGIPTPADDDVEGDEASSPDQGPTRSVRPKAASRPEIATRPDSPWDVATALRRFWPLRFGEFANQHVAEFGRGAGTALRGAAASPASSLGADGRAVAAAQICGRPYDPERRPRRPIATTARPATTTTGPTTAHTVSPVIALPPT
jgi:hypothetical protein